jgi:IPT/TIG domain
MSLWKKNGKTGAPMKKNSPATDRPQIEGVAPQTAIAGGEIAIQGSGFVRNGTRCPTVRFGEREGDVMLSSANRLVVRVPEGVSGKDLTVDCGRGISAPASVTVGVPLAENLHPVTSPAADAAGNIFSTFSGSRGQKVPVSIYKIDRQHAVHPFATDLMNATGLAFDRSGILYVSSRLEGTIYSFTPDGHRSIYAKGMGVATGIAFDEDENLYVGDRTGTIFKIARDRQIFVFATLEPSVSAYHLCFGAAGKLYVTGPTTSSYDHVYRITPKGEVSSFYRGLGRPQGLACDAEGNLYVAGSMNGRRGVVRINPKGAAELAVSGGNIIGMAFTRQRSMIIATHTSLIELTVGIQGRPLLQ